MIRNAQKKVGTDHSFQYRLINQPIQDHRMKCCKYQLVSVDIKLKTGSDAHLLKWSLGTCSNSKDYTNDKEFVEEGCYLAPGKYTLNCYNTKHPYGWKKGVIVINGHSYCDDFMGYKALRHIFISSKCFYLYGCEIDRDHFFNTNFMAVQNEAC